MRDTRVAGLELGSLQELNGLPAPLRDGLYGRLIPSEVCARFGVDPTTGLNAAGHRLLRVFAPTEQSWARIELRASRDDRDPLVLVDVEMGPFAVPELSFVQVTDPGADRFGIDRDEDGQDTLFGTVTRNLPEERRALAAGLAPGQVRRGLRLLGRVLDSMDDFCRLLGKELFLVEPLFYHSALLYERHGCDYFLGRELMETIDGEFRPGWPAAPGARRVHGVSRARLRVDDPGAELGHSRRHPGRARRPGVGRGEDVPAGRSTGERGDVPHRGLLSSRHDGGQEARSQARAAPEADAEEAAEGRASSDRLPPTFEAPSTTRSGHLSA